MAGYSAPVFTWYYQGQIAAGGSVRVYQSGTTTPVTIYADGALTTPLPNPLTLDANGQCLFYLATIQNIRMDGYTAAGGFIESIDPIFPVASASGGSLTIPLIIGGTTASSTLTLKSTSAVPGAGNTDQINFVTSNSLSATPSLAGITTSLSCQSFFDNKGRFVMTVGTPSTTAQDNTYNGNNPFVIPNQPAGADTSFNLTGTYLTDGVTANMATFTVYAKNNAAGTGGINAVLGTGVACSATSGVSGGAFLARANATGAIATGVQCAAAAYAAGTDTIAALFVAGGDGVNAINSYLQFQSLAAGNSAANMIILNDSSINPVKTTGSLFTSQSTNVSCAYGFKCDTMTFSTAFLKSVGFMVDGSGNLTAQSLTSSGNLSVTSNGGIGTAPVAAAFLKIAAGTTAKSQINFVNSTAPTSPNNGDFWFDGTNFKAEVSGVTKTFTIT